MSRTNREPIRRIGQSVCVGIVGVVLCIGEVVWQSICMPVELVQQRNGAMQRGDVMVALCMVVVA